MAWIRRNLAERCIILAFKTVISLSLIWEAIIPLLYGLLRFFFFLQSSCNNAIVSRAVRFYFSRKKYFQDYNIFINYFYEFSCDFFCFSSSSSSKSDGDVVFLKKKNIVWKALMRNLLTEKFFMNFNSDPIFIYRKIKNYSWLQFHTSSSF